MRFFLVTDSSVPEESVRLLREACEVRAIAFEPVIAAAFDFDLAKRPSPGDLLYRAAGSPAAERIEQFLWSPTIACFYRGPDGPFFRCNNQAELVSRSGVPVPGAVTAASSRADVLANHVRRLGGFPVVLKVLGRSNGVGVVIAESMRSLRSLVDYALALGHSPLLIRYLPDAVHWRLIVLGAAVLASYRNPRKDEDFRSKGPVLREDFEAEPPVGAAEIAVKATRALGFEFAGVDVLEDSAGAVFFLEANFPCYYPHAQIGCGVDIAGRMVDYLTGEIRRGRFPECSH